MAKKKSKGKNSKINQSWSNLIKLKWELKFLFTNIYNWIYPRDSERNIITVDNNKIKIGFSTLSKVILSNQFSYFSEFYQK